MLSVVLLAVEGNDFNLSCDLLVLFHCPNSFVRKSFSFCVPHNSAIPYWYRYKAGHATRHWKETQHCYSLELETQRVWDYVGDNYVHRLIQSKTDGKLVELNSHCVHANDGCGSCDCVNSGISEALLNNKVEAVIFSIFYC